MQTIESYELVSTEFPSTSFEACPTFGADSHGSPVCAACGWLDREHHQAVADPVAHPVAHPVADVHTLPQRPSRRAAPKRLAS